MDIRLPSLMFLIRSLLAVVRRFPITALSSAVAGIALMWYIESEDQEAFNLFMSALLGLPVFTAITVFCESRNWAPARYYSLLGVAAIFLGTYYRYLPTGPGLIEEIEYPRFLLLMLIAHLAASFAPYLGKYSVKDFWEYNRQLFAFFITAAVFSTIIWGGLAAAILAVNELFNLNIDEKIYGHLFAAISGFFTTSFFLHHFPKDFEFEESEYTYHQLFRSLCKFVLIPIVALYFIILYVYGAKILFSWTLPKGWVSGLVLGFSIAGILTYLLSYMLPKQDDSPVVQQYHRWFWPVLLPLVLLLFVAVGRRIGDYGITESRFLAAHAGLWLLFCGLYFVISKSDNIKIVPTSLAAFALVATLGPFNAFSVSQRSQVSELQELLEKNRRWEDGRFKESLRDVSEVDADRIYSVLRYLERRKALHRIDSWFDVPVDELPKAGRAATLAKNILKKIGVDRAKIKMDGHVYVTPNTERLSGNVRGFTTYYRVELGRRSMAPARGKYIAIGDDGQSLVWREKRGSGHDDIEAIDLSSLISKWESESENNNFYLPIGEEIIDHKGDNAEMRFFVKNLTLKMDGEQTRIESVYGLMFIKEK